MIKRIRSWFSPVAVGIRVSSLSAQLDKIEEARMRQAAALVKRGAEIAELAEASQRDVDEARRTHTRYEIALEEVREQNRVLEMTIQTLVASHKLLQERYDTETAIQVRNRVAVSSQMRE